MPRKTDKRVRLVEAAKTLIYQQGFNLTTLADIAQEADVPLGNVYYYFKTKVAIGMAVLESRSLEWSGRLKAWNELPDPALRLEQLLQYGLETVELTARFGCPVGSLCQELGKQGDALSNLAAKLLYDMLTWTEKQFEMLGLAERANSAALNFIAGIQGAYLLMHTFKDPSVMQREQGELQRWLHSLLKKPLPTGVSARQEQVEIA